MFFDIFEALCKEKGVSCRKAATDMGLSNSTATKWKKTGATPDTSTLSAVAQYFNVPVDYLINGEQKEKPTTPKSDGLTESDRELMDYLEVLRTRPECRMLMKTAKGATKEQVEANVKFIESLRGYNSDD